MNLRPLSVTDLLEYRTLLEGLQVEPSGIRARIGGRRADGEAGGPWPAGEWEDRIGRATWPPGTKVRLEALDSEGRPIPGGGKTLQVERPDPVEELPFTSEVVRRGPAHSDPEAPPVDARSVHLHAPPDVQVAAVYAQARVDVETLRVHRDIITAQMLQNTRLSGMFSSLMAKLIDLAITQTAEAGDRKADAAYADAIRNAGQDPEVAIALSEHALVKDALDKVGRMLDIAGKKDEPINAPPLPDSLKG